VCAFDVSDPAQPAILASAASEQVQPKVVPIPSGGFYMSWYDNRSGGYDPWVQRFDARGIGVWPDGGVRVLDTSFSSTEDYGLTMDNAGNAVIVTRSDIGGGVKIVAQAVSPSGTLLWGPTGTQLAATGNAPKAGRAGDGAAVAGWSEGNRAKVMRLNADGTAAWATASTITDGAATTILADLQPGDGGSVIASVVRYTTFTGAKTLQAQKYSATGTAQWAATNVRVFPAPGGEETTATDGDFAEAQRSAAIFVIFAPRRSRCFAPSVRIVRSGIGHHLGVRAVELLDIRRGIRRLAFRELL
jgi:hypothetical protein